MSGDQYLNASAIFNSFTWKTAPQSFVGVADAGKLVALNASGLLDPLFLGFTVTIGQGGGNVVGNTAYGVSALLANASGLRSTALGYQALLAQVTAQDNTAVGYQCMKAVTGGGNTAIGSQVMMNLVNGTTNVSLGYGSGSAIVAGSGNVLVGPFAGTTIGGGSINTILGSSANVAAAADTNCVVIGSNVVGLGSNTVIIGDVQITVTQLRGAVRTGNVVTVAGLIPAATAGKNGREFVTDATVTLTAGIGTIVVGGGANNVPVISDGTNWRIG